jgi:AraC family transcriptional regulator
LRLRFEDHKPVVQMASVGVSAHQYVMRRRVEYVRELLPQTRLDVDAIARKVGFGNSTPLARHFRKLVGVPPSQLRKNS